MAQLDQPGLDRVGDLVEGADVHPLRGIGCDDSEAHARFGG
jgi:hypothetical protein